MQLEIYKIEEYKKNRKLVYLDEGTPAFCLYTKEIKKYELAEGSIISEEVYGKIVELLSKRARERCLYLLESMARTERQLRDKLKDAYYPEEAIDYVVVHELAHIKHHNHSRSFYALVGKYLPDYKRREKMLREDQY